MRHGDDPLPLFDPTESVVVGWERLSDDPAAVLVHLRSPATEAYSYTIPPTAKVTAVVVGVKGVDWKLDPSTLPDWLAACRSMRVTARLRFADDGTVTEASFHAAT